MTLITEDYKALQKDLHERFDYGKGADANECALLVRGWMPNGGTVLDYGCGQGHLGRTLRPGYDVRDYDPCIEGKDHPPAPADIVVCADVLEHIEPDCLDAVLEHIASLAKLRALLVIATGPSKKVMADGRTAHLIVEGADWWRARLSRFFRVDHLEDRTTEGKGVLAIVEAKG